MNVEVSEFSSFVAIRSGDSILVSMTAVTIDSVAIAHFNDDQNLLGAVNALLLGNGELSGASGIIFETFHVSEVEGYQKSSDTSTASSASTAEEPQDSHSGQTATAIVILLMGATLIFTVMIAALCRAKEKSNISARLMFWS